MKTYQDLMAIRENEQDTMEFILTVISEHKTSDLYRISEKAGQYYRHLNPTIMAAQKIVYDMLGRAQVDKYAKNNKIPCRYYFYFVTQEVQYLLGNGVSFGENTTKEALGGPKFDIALQDLTTKAINAGQAYGFWNYDHLEVFAASPNGSEPAFAPLWDEENGALRAGVRFWQVDAKKPLRVTLYEEDGLTEYIRRPGEEMEVMKEKRPYVLTEGYSEATDETIILDGKNYPSFPIIPLYNINRQSELLGSQGTLDAYDLMASQMVNNVDEGNLIYWVLKNYGGMDEIDDANFLQQLRTTHVAHADGGGAGSDIDVHTVEAPVAASETALARLRDQLFDDFMALDTKNIASGAATATQIKAAYEPLNAKVNLLEACVSDFILALLELVGIDDNPTYTRSVIINKQEETTNVLQAAQYLSEQYVTSKLLEINGDIDKYEDVEAQKISGDMARYPLEEEYVEE